MTKKLLTVLALLTVAVAVVVSGCGSGVPSNSVAERWRHSDQEDGLRPLAQRGRQAVGAAGQHRAARRARPAELHEVRRRAPEAAGGQGPEAALGGGAQGPVRAAVQRPQDPGDAVPDPVAVARSRRPTRATSRAKPAAVQKQLDDQIKQSFPKRADFDKFLKTSGMTMADLLFRVKVDVLTQQVRQKIVAGKDKVSDAAVTAYYNKNKSRFAQPERRDLLVVLTKTKAQGQPGQGRAPERHRLEGRRQEVLDRPGLQGAGRQAARRGQGPAGEVVRHRDLLRPRRASSWARSRRSSATTSSRSPRSRPPRSRPSSRRTTRSSACCARSRSRTAINAFVKDYQKKYKDKTKCAKGYVIDSCKNAPKTKTGTAPVSGAAPQQTPATPQHDARGAARAPPASSGMGSRPAPWSRSTRSRAGCGASAPGTASRTSARSSRTRWRRPTSWPTPRTRATTPSCSTSWATCCSRSTSCRSCWRSAARATWRPWRSTAARS